MKNKITTKRAYLLSILLFLILSVNYTINMAFADTQADISVKGQLLDFPPCDIYSSEGKDAPIYIRFDEIAIQRIDGKNYRQNWALTITCDNTLGKNVSVVLGYKGDASLFDNQALVTNKTGLGIRLYQNNGNTVELNKPITLTVSGNSSEQIKLYAIPVKDAASELTEGQFTATATIEINYP